MAHSALVVQSWAAPALGHEATQADPVSAEFESKAAQQVQPGAQFMESPHVSRAYTPLNTTPTQPVSAGKHPVG
jgi:hypothetical protein